MLGIAAVFVAILVVVAWGIAVQRALVTFDENVNNAMSQIGVQLASRFDALTSVLDLVKGYNKHESETIIETIKARRGIITGSSTPEEVIKQESVFAEVLGKISVLAEAYPELKASDNYQKAMGSVETFENNVRHSRMIYNDSVTKLNRQIRMFPISLIAGPLGFGQRLYLEDDVAKAAMPGMK